MIEPEVRVMGPEYDGVEEIFGSLTGKMGRIVSDIVAKQNGLDSVLTPTHVQIAPLSIQNERLFVINSWHQTPGGSKWQKIEATFDVRTDDRHAYFHHREGEIDYWLTTVETLVLGGLAQRAAEYDELNSPLAREAL